MKRCQRYGEHDTITCIEGPHKKQKLWFHLPSTFANRPSTNPSPKPKTSPKASLIAIQPSNIWLGRFFITSNMKDTYRDWKQNLLYWLFVLSNDLATLTYGCQSLYVSRRQHGVDKCANGMLVLRLSCSLYCSITNECWFYLRPMSQTHFVLPACLAKHVVANK